MKKKICIITQCNLPVPAVSGGAVETLIEYLIDENEIYKKFNFSIITVDNEFSVEKQKLYKHSSFVHIKERNQYISKIYNLIYRILKKLKIYIPYSLESYSVLNYLKKNKNNFDLFLYEAGPTTQLPLLCKIIEKDKIITHLHWDGMANDKIANSFKYLLPVSKYIGQNWKEKCNNNQNIIIPFDNCVDLSLFSNKLNDDEKEKFKQTIGISNKNKVVLYIGRIVPEKGVLEMLEGIENSNVDMEIIIVGSSNFGKKQSTKYEKKVFTFSNKMKKKVHWIGFVKKEFLYKYYSISDLLIMPSKFKEPAGLVCIEAQMYGIPIMVSNAGGLPEYASKSAIMLNPNNLSSDIENSINSFFKNYDKNKIIEMINEGKKKSINYDKKQYYISFNKIIDLIRR